MTEEIERILKKSYNRVDISSNFINTFDCKYIAEIGVFKGYFTKEIFERCGNIIEYTMIDSWRQLSDWNKPANVDNKNFEEFYKKALNETDFAKDKRKVLKGKTNEVIEEINDNSLDFVYIDGDHTLKGISIDLINIWDKVKEEGFIIGDDFSLNIWQHGYKFEPTMVFPFAVYFAEAIDRKIYVLPFNQFLIAKNEKGFEFINFTHQEYNKTTLNYQFLKY